jgi:hypothetical protein
MCALGVVSCERTARARTSAVPVFYRLPKATRRDLFGIGFFRSLIIGRGHHLPGGRRVINCNAVLRSISEYLMICIQRIQTIHRIVGREFRH